MKLHRQQIPVLTTLLLALSACPAMAQSAGDFPAATDSPEGMQLLASEADSAPAFNVQQLVYAEREEMPVHLLLIRSGAAPGPLTAGAAASPLVVYVQGSAWFAQDVSGTIPKLAAFAQDTGYVMASVQYRPSTTAIAPAQIEDVLSAIRYLRANAGRLGIDPERIAIWGDSSGGHMAAMTGTTGGLATFVTDDNADQSSTVRAVVDFYGPTDFVQMQDHPSAMDHNLPSSPESTVIGGPIQDPANADKVQAYNPISYISSERRLPPFLIMHGDRDPLVPFNQSVLLYEALRKAGQDVTFYKVQDAGHGTRFFTPAVLGVVKAFLAEHL